MRLKYIPHPLTKIPRVATGQRSRAVLIARGYKMKAYQKFYNLFGRDAYATYHEWVYPRARVFVNDQRIL